MKRALLYLKLMFWVKALRTFQFVCTRNFITGKYVCVDSGTTNQLEIKRISEIAEVYEVTIENASLKVKWVSYFDNRMFVLCSHDFEKTIAFIPEEGKLTYEGFLFTKNISKINI